MVNARFQIEQSGFEPWPGTLYSVPVQDTQVYKWVPANLMVG